MSDLIDREHVIDFLKLTRDSEYEKSMSAEVKHKSVIRSKHDAHVAFCDYLIEYVNQVPTHPTPSNTLGALDCVSRQAAIDAFWKLEAELRPSAIDAVLDMLKNLPSVQPEQELLKDGTLVVKTDFDMTKFDRVNVIQNGTHYGDLFYQDDDTRRKGRWIKIMKTNESETATFYTPTWICGDCKTEYDGAIANSIIKFCYNCGADLRGEQDE